MAKLGTDLFAALDKLKRLLDKTSGPDQAKLQTQYDRLSEQAQELIDANVQAATAEYAASIKALADADKKIQAAIDGLAHAIDVINEVAKAIDIVDSLLKKVGLVP